MNRREALSRVSILLGGTIIGAEAFLSGCKTTTTKTAAFSTENIALLDEVGETIIPTTPDSPGAKAAQIGLTRQLAHELGPWNITVNNVAPGFVRSNPTTEKQWESYGAEGQQRLVDSIALKRLGSPADIAHAVLFFASEIAGWISGQVLSVDGGK